MENAQIADTLDVIADLLEFTGANPFRVRAYRNGARTIRDLAEPAAAVVADPDRSLTQFEGIGKDLADKVTTLLATGRIPLLDELSAQVPQSVLALVRIPGVGPKKAAALYKELGVKTLEELRTACELARVRVLKGFGPKTEQAILQGLSIAESANIRLLWADADLHAQQVLAHLREAPGVRQIELAGSYRRGRETVGDLDVVVVADEPAAVMDRFALLTGLGQVVGRGDTKMSIRLASGLQIDLRVVPEESFGAALQYFTGSKDHNVVLRSLAKKAGLKINEYGVFRDEERIAGRTEEEIYAAIGLPLFAPTMREARREFDWAAAGALPRLVEAVDIQGDLHMHTHATDGKASVEEMAAAARARGLKYIAITDHSKRVSMANGLTADRLRAQWAEIDRINAQSPDGFLILKGIECDILEKGGMDLPDDVLAEGDWIIASIHYGQQQSRSQITERMLGAIENPHVAVIAHPTGRLINRRKAYELDLDAVFKAAKAHRKLLELNSNPHRLDLDDVACAMAKEHGIPIVISTDAHSPGGLDVLRYGILQAQRGGLTAADVANARTWPELRRLLGRA